MTSTMRQRTPTSVWDEPAGVAPRGTLIVLTGRGETPRAYRRFGGRLAADAYKVRVVTTDLDDLDATRREVAALLADPGLPVPRVLVGSDAGATFAAAFASGFDGVDALVLAGLVRPPTSPPAGPAAGRLAGAVAAAVSWDLELETRSACPAYRRVLTDDDDFTRGSLATPLPPELADAALAPSTLPTLLVHGGSDPITTVEDAFAALGGPATTRAVVVAGGRHDILNDVTHRSVAATVVLFLESLRIDPSLPPVVRDLGAAS